ncbi:MAG TPA: protease pro-enzyme activation domain-containing protein [Pseudonocardiaceae bacterium]|nr:protease pro-enzyme activation domain-containing protein [Pseudonocardiaceae bacterium]
MVSSPPVGTVAAGQNLTVQLWLKGNETGATAFADSVSDPKNPSYRKYLSPAAFTAAYGPSAADAAAVSSWLAQQGFTEVTTDAQRSYVRASASAATVQNAFKVQLKTFKVAGQPAPVMSNDRAITLPASIANHVVGVTGLDSAQPKRDIEAAPQPTSGVPNCSNYWGQNQQTVPEVDGVTSVPTRVCGYTGAQLRAAYGMNDTNTGKGVTVAYIEVGQPDKMFQTLTTWAAANGLPAPKSQNYSELLIGSGGACGNGFDIEEQLDVESGYAMAPDQHELMVGGDSCDERLGGLQALIDADNAVLDGNGNQPLASATSNSWESFDESAPGETSNIMHSVLLRAAAEGVGMYYSSGDGPGVGEPSDDPYATAVGGTSIGLDANNNRLFETGWSNDEKDVNPDNTLTDQGIQGGAGGGVSLLFNEPRYQKGVVPPKMALPKAGNRTTPGRTLPDVSADADSFTGMSVGFTEPGANGGPDVYDTHPVGGTSLAAPLFAGMVAAADQGQPASFGFINPLLYSVYGGNAYHDPLPFTASTPTAYRHGYSPAIDFLGRNKPAYVATLDDQDPTYTDQVTAKGFDTMTGVGTPNGQNFVNALRKV